MSNQSDGNAQYSSEQKDFYASQSFDEAVRLRTLQQDYQGKAHRDETTSQLAKYLIFVMGISFCLYWLVVAFIPSEQAAKLDALRTGFNAWVQMMSAFVGAAIAFYFSKEK